MKKSIQHGAAVVTERRRHVIVNGKVMRNVDVESRCQHLQSTKTIRGCKFKRSAGQLLNENFDQLKFLTQYNAF